MKSSTSRSELTTTLRIAVPDPNRLVPIQVNDPKQNRTLVVKVPVNCLKEEGPDTPQPSDLGPYPTATNSSSTVLNQVLAEAMATAFNLPQDSAERHIQSKINDTFSKHIL